MLEQIKKYLLYAGVDRESYEQVREKIERTNRSTALVFSAIAFVLVGIMMILSFFQDGFEGSKPVYIAGMAACILIFSLSFAAKRYPIMSYWAVYTAAAVFFHYGIAIGTLTRPEEQTVTFMVMLLFIPLIFVDRPVRMASCLLYFISIFIIEAFRTKTGSILSVDVTDAIVFGILGIVSGTVVIHVKMRGYVLENKLQIMSEMDQLTGLNNRNSYEWRLEDYPAKCKVALGCVYIDVNGLHYLNNAEGHRQGDIMLRYVAEEVRNQFGSQDTYRIGGDEYVAFVPDAEESALKEKLQALICRVEEQKYHIAVGCEIQPVEGLDVNQLIVRAESKMYEDKLRYYEEHNRKAR